MREMRRRRFTEGKLLRRCERRGEGRGGDAGESVSKRRRRVLISREGETREDPFFSRGLCRVGRVPRVEQ